MLNNTVGTGSSSILQQRLRNPPEPVHGSPRGAGMQYAANPAFSMGGPAAQYMMSPEHNMSQQPAYYTVQGHGQAPFYQNDHLPQQPDYQSSHLQQIMAGASPAAAAVALESPARAPSVASQRSATSPPPVSHERAERPPRSPGFFAELKPPKGPEKPLIPYLRFSKNIWETVKKDHPGTPFAEIGRIIGEQWRTCPEDVKQKYMDDYNRDKEKYAIAQKAFLESPEYQEFLSQKNKRDQMEEETERAGRRREEHSKPPPVPAGPPQRSASSGGVTMNVTASGSSSQPLHGPLEELQSMSQRMLPPKPATGVPNQGERPPGEPDEDADDYLKAKHTASVRYQRNHKLMAELSSDAIVPDGRMVVNEQRITLLRKQVQSLTHHQDRLLLDQKELVEKHESKKRKLMEDAENFRVRWTQVKEECKPVSKEQYQALVEKHYKAYEKLYAEHQLLNQSKTQLPSQDIPYNPPAHSVPMEHPSVESIASPPADRNQVASHVHVVDMITEPISSPIPPQFDKVNDYAPALKLPENDLLKAPEEPLSESFSDVDISQVLADGNNAGATDPSESEHTATGEESSNDVSMESLDAESHVEEHEQREQPSASEDSLEQSFMSGMEDAGDQGDASVVSPKETAGSVVSPKETVSSDPIPIESMDVEQPDGTQEASKEVESVPLSSKTSPPPVKRVGLTAYSDDSNSDIISESEPEKNTETTVVAPPLNNATPPPLGGSDFDGSIPVISDEAENTDIAEPETVKHLGSKTSSPVSPELSKNTDIAESLKETEKLSGEALPPSSEGDISGNIREVDIADGVVFPSPKLDSPEEGGGQGYADYML
ncbi:uncharacterized protein LOC129581990 [Paramacrobiotus metropolitanus]|uniref:uncharacterized protein LOC129581990 n=1 Tax=Paramacrobiotus metropolitanus TaxID=2943436 RepID=UPI00244591D8|nr:uncharacterized protein LOC129581990 [Paramacrobiotus metropolitanus]